MNKNDFFEIVYNNHNKELMKFAKKTFHNKERAEDILQETYLELIQIFDVKKISRYFDPTTVYCKNLLEDIMSIKFTNLKHEDSNCHMNKISTKKRYDSTHLKQELNKMNKKYKMALIYKYLYGYPTDIICQKLELDNRMQLHHIIEKAKKKLMKHLILIVFSGIFFF